MKKTVLCIFLALCLCLCALLASCKKDPDPPPDNPPPVTTDPGELGEKKGNIYYTADPGGDVNPPEPNLMPVDENGTLRY